MWNDSLNLLFTSSFASNTFHFSTCCCLICSFGKNKNVMSIVLVAIQNVPTTQWSVSYTCQVAIEPTYWRPLSLRHIHAVSQSSRRHKMSILLLFQTRCERVRQFDRRWTNTEVRATLHGYGNGNFGKFVSVCATNCYEEIICFFFQVEFCFRSGTSYALISSISCLPRKC